MNDSNRPEDESGYECWLRYRPLDRWDGRLAAAYRGFAGCIRVTDGIRAAGAVSGGLARTAVDIAVGELRRAIAAMLGIEPSVYRDSGGSIELRLTAGSERRELPGAYRIDSVGADGGARVTISSSTEVGLLYGSFALIRLMQTRTPLDRLSHADAPRVALRMLDHWDNADGSVERGYAGRSLFLSDGTVTPNLARLEDYARILASVGINAVAVNNVNVRSKEALLTTDSGLPGLARLAALFRPYGIRVFTSIDYSSPISQGGLDSADPLDAAVAEFWRRRASEVYAAIPDFGGFLVKADSENRPGPHTYGRNHAEGANVLARALAPFGGTVVWRCFVYNCHQDWRDRATDRAKAAYETFAPLDGAFDENVILQVKNGPMDFQVREPVSPIIGAMDSTNLMLELQITQEYTGQQTHLCYLVPQWREVLDFDTVRPDGPSVVHEIIATSAHRSGVAGVANVGDSENWTGHHLAQANLYGFALLAWNPARAADEITDEWSIRTFGPDRAAAETVSAILRGSWETYERYTAPLGVGWMCNVSHHYGPSPDGYEYSEWGTYHFADRDGVGVDRTARTGTGYTRQYHAENAARYESLESCPDELLLFFHHVPYTHRLSNGMTVIQHIYETHFRGVEEVRAMLDRWTSGAGLIDGRRFEEVRRRLEAQLGNAELWRDVINTYFYRKSGIADERGRSIYP